MNVTFTKRGEIKLIDNPSLPLLRLWIEWISVLGRNRSTRVVDSIEPPGNVNGTQRLSWSLLYNDLIPYEGDVIISRCSITVLMKHTNARFITQNVWQTDVISKPFQHPWLHTSKQNWLRPMLHAYGAQYGMIKRWPCVYYHTAWSRSQGNKRSKRPCFQRLHKRMGKSDSR